MKIDVITLFPEMFDCIKNSIVKRAIDKKKICLETVNIRDFSKDKHKKCDDLSYGGGAGMVLTPQPLFDAVMYTKNKQDISIKENKNSINKTNKSSGLDAEKKLVINKSQIVVYMSPKGELFNQNIALELSKYKHLIVVCGHYEGIDERIIKLCIDREISIGDYVLTGGEIPAMAIIDAVVRLVPNVINEHSLLEESFSNELLEYPQYTRPQIFNKLTVPDILISGNHEKIKEWRHAQSLKITKGRRPDLYKKYIKKNKDIRRKS